MKMQFGKTTWWVLVMIPVTEVLIKMVGIQRAIQIIFRGRELKCVEKNDNLPGAKRRLKTLKTAVASSRWKGNCLSRSIVLHRLLQKNGISSTLCIGVRNNPKFKAHAWVEHNGIPLNAGKKVHQRYTTVEDLRLVTRSHFS